MQLKTEQPIPILILFIFLLSFSFSLYGKTDLTIEFSERFRIVSWDHPVTLDSVKETGTTFTRNRTSIGLDWKLSETTGLYFKATNEFRIYFRPGNDFNFHEVFIDNLYLKVRNIFKLPVTLTLGRQNIFLGEGFIILDGNTYDGSRSVYFDAARADIELGRAGGLTLFTLYARKTDEFLPVINDRNQLLNENDIRGSGLYYRIKPGRAVMDLYYLNKKTRTENNGPWGLSVDTAGARASFPVARSLHFTAEGAVQSGSSDNERIRSFGGHFHLDRKIMNHRILKGIIFGGFYLRGDSPGDNDLNNWHPPFSRWPKWSESYIYTLINEEGIAYWSNISSLYFTLKTELFRGGALESSVLFLGSPEKDISPDFPGGQGNYRGTILINRLNFVLSRSLSGHLLWEHFRPGNFYFSGAENYNWFRFELMYTMKPRR